MTKKNVEIMNNMPDKLTEYKSGTLGEKYDIKETNYNKIYPELPWVINKNELLLPKELPAKLYNVKKYNLESTENNQNAKSYAILSYIREGEEIKDRVEELKNHLWWNEEILMGENKKKGLFLSSTKSLHKAIQVCQMLDIDYLWMDRVCSVDRNKEASKMNQYYSKADITLIAIQTNIDKEILDDLQYSLKKEKNKFANINEIVSNSMKILEVIVKSKWFLRAWTFQEGILSRRTIFMFDDLLVDGRFMAAIWTICQPQRIIQHIKTEDIFEGSLKIATPLGWVYCKSGYDEEDKLSMSLYEALMAVNNREKSGALDAIYSVLGLLPYGSEAEVDWDLEPQEALINVTKIAVRNGYGEPLSWHGEGDNWLPKIENNLILICGGINVECGECRENKKLCGENNECKKVKDIHFDEKNNSIHSIKIKGIKYFVDETYGEPSKREEEFSIDGGIYTRVVKLVDSEEKIGLLGTRETLGKIKEGSFLLVPNKEEWKSDKPFALLVKELEKEIYQRIGLVELISESENKLISDKDKKNKKGVNSEIPTQSIQLFNLNELSDSFQETNFQVQILPKK